MGDWLTISQASQESGYTADYLRTLVRQKRIKAKKVFVVWLVSKSGLTKYLKEQTEQGERRGRKRLT